MENIIDIGVNITASRYRSPKPIVDRAKKAGVFPLVFTGSTVTNSVRSAEIAHECDCYFTAGVHPHHAKDIASGPDWQTLVVPLLKDSRCVAVGETGLDYNRMFSSIVEQQTAFRRHLDIAVERNLPIFLHEREAHDDFVTILREYPKLPPAVVHCFTSTPQHLQVYLEMGMYIGLTGFICMSPRGDTVRNICHTIPLNKLLIETDAPFMAPPGLPRTNYPQNLWAVVKTLSECYGVSEECIARQTRENSEYFFRIKSNARI